MTLRYHEIAEARHRILNPLTEAKLDLLGGICGLAPGRRVLDLACGKGEMLSRWARAHGVAGLGVDISEVFLAAARARAADLDVAGQVTFEQADAAAWAAERAGGTPFDVVSCIGATWIGGGLGGTLGLMRPLVADDGLLLVGEIYWAEDTVPAEAHEALGIGPEDCATLAGTLDRFQEAGCELIEMTLADGDSWDRYAAAQWHTTSDWLRDNPDAEDAAEIRSLLTSSRRAHLAYQRRYLGWGVFVLRP
ncbi:methyltransferase domain-containing protein [Streptomyces sp. MP131-18]|uniref:SAM-dependent methyltransferase n=1 Tax=Streptomyces sp. MP131-18 TaxID=1857892 RepID=UPI00097C504F|nr:methyltransferase domain-containing protein [Streptomyces sp. MP131-18]ONK13614.1 ubiquinone/menaquinone biosynthesis methyltransferase [Streptomyces sp. MP131-18]